MIITSANDGNFTKLPISGGSLATAITMIENALANPKEFGDARNPY
jgi:short subunit dehydrogenase-like uncharacterized protein